ncbi:MAG: metallopeptidase TldD-related protein [Planctomycetaceae bacterium]|nr:hypothetical protein [Planctomycetaceae bacterium]
MQQTFYKLADELTATAGKNEVILLYLAGERSDFVRFNKAAVRQPGSVLQQCLRVELIEGRRHAAKVIGISADEQADLTAARQALDELRTALGELSEDPYLLFAEQVHSTEQIGPDRLPDAADAVDTVLAAAGGLDLVGLYAAGEITRGFANSLGQRNWFSTHSFNLDWSFYHAADKAVKTQYAGFAWDAAAFGVKMDLARRQLDVMKRSPKTVPPGQYRVYLSPAAVGEVMNMLCWGGFGLKAHRTRTTSLLKLIEGEQTFAPGVALTENTREGLAANFSAEGFIKPDSVSLVEGGRHAGALASPRSAKEYAVPTNGADRWESPASLDMAAGELSLADVPTRIGEGVYVNTLWYLNYSDRPGGRITGMTRFATFWVEGGQIAAPLNVMRFDETVYRMFGSNLLGLTAERDLIADSETYDSRSTASMRLPGALIDNFAFTL